MQSLLTKDGRIIGNAIVVSKADTSLGVLYTIETDFGNTALLDEEEISAWFHWGEPMEYKAWNLRRRELLFPDDGK